LSLLLGNAPIQTKDKDTQMTMPLTFDEYQAETKSTAIYPGQGATAGLSYAALGACGEAGEFAEHVKKIMRDDNFCLTPERRTLMIKEIGDELWYIAAKCNELEVSLGDVAEQNLAKLRDRAQRGTIQGSGDTR
jgi:NTP pyrophosphatase (non-canonical NTP hydrolase)